MHRENPGFPGDPVVSGDLHQRRRGMGGSPGGPVVLDHLLDETPAPQLELHLPCGFDGRDPKKPQFVDLGASIDWRTNPGRTLNYYHSQFSKSLGRSSLQDILIAAHMGAKLDTSVASFHARNETVGWSCDVMIAFTWGDGFDGAQGWGTLNTWKKARTGARKVHVPLRGLGEAGRSVEEFVAGIPWSKEGMFIG